jgi:hypothetical protein
MGENFSKIKIGAIFTTPGGETFRKTSELVYEDMAGIEHYIDPFFEKKLAGIKTEPISIDTRARVIKESEVEEKPKTKKKKSKKSKG